MNEKLPTLIIPPVGLVVEEPREEDWILGAALEHEILQLNGQWDEFLPVEESQRPTNNFDPFGCVSWARNNCNEILHRRLFGHEFNGSDRYLTKKSNTIPYQGNSVTKVCDTFRDNLTCLEFEYPFVDSEQLFYQDIPEDIDKLAIKQYNQYQVNDEWVERIPLKSYSTTENLKNALLYGPLMVSVDGNYQYAENGMIGRFLQYTHEVVLYGYELNSNESIKCWKVFDSYYPFKKRFTGDYKFGYPKLCSLKKKWNMKLYKKKGEPAIYALDPEDKVLVPFATGAVPGGKAFKTLYGVTDYKDIPREDVDELPYPIANYEITTTFVKNFNY